MLHSKLEKFSDCAPFLLRVLVGLVLINHGYGKLFGGIGGFEGQLTGLGVPMPGLMAWLVAIVEFVGGAFILLGFLTRVVAIPVIIQFTVIALMKIFPTGLQRDLSEATTLLAKVGTVFGSIELDLFVLVGALTLLMGAQTKYSLENLIFKKEIV